MPRISVLVPTYKPRVAHLREALDRLLVQTETDWECIICDEPTDTDTALILEPYLQDPRFRYERNQKCLGIGGNWNHALSLATAPVIAYLFQDDLWEPDYLATALKIFAENPSVGFISLQHEYRYDDDLWTRDGYELVQEVKKQIAPGRHAGRAFLRWWLERNMHPNVIGEPPFVVMRREVTEEVGPFNEHMPQFLDVEYWLRCLLVTDWYFESASHGAFRVHADAASALNNASGTGLYDRLTVFAMLIRGLDGDLRKVAVASRNRSVEDMVGKFFNRVRKGKGVSRTGSGKVVNFALMHPFIMGKAVARAIFKRGIR